MRVWRMATGEPMNGGWMIKASCASAHAVKAVSPYSVSGVSGALLSAMLDQRVGNRLDEIGPTDRTMLVPVTARNAGQVNDAALPFVTAATA